jgi:hypothetical protein
MKSFFIRPCRSPFLSSGLLQSYERMISLGVLKFLFYMMLPYALSNVLAYMAGRKKSDKERGDKDGPVRPLTNLELFVYSVTIIAIFNYGLATYGPAQSESFFQKLQCPTTAPTFLLREHYQAYCQRRAAESKAFAEAMAAHDAAGAPSFGSTEGDDPNASVYKRHRYAARAPFLLPYLRWFGQIVFKQPVVGDSAAEEDCVSPEQLEYEHMAFLFDKLKMPSKRTIYLRFGEDAFLDGSSFCREDTDYMLFIAPAIFFTYLQFLLVVGILSSLPRKAHWRSIMLLFAAILLVCEVRLIA